MKNFLIIFLLGAIAGAFGLHYYNEHYSSPPPVGYSHVEAPAAEPAPSTAPAPVAASPSRPSVVDNARNTAYSARDAISDKLTQWHLTPDEIKADLARTGSVVRTKAQAAGETLAAATSNARVIAVIKAKYTLDKELSARTIDVDCKEGKVTLKGTVTAPSLIGKAVADALDTDGVKEVSSLLTVQP
jgi:hypothetical protein